MLRKFDMNSMLFIYYLLEIFDSKILLQKCGNQFFVFVNQRQYCIQPNDNMLDQL